MTRDPRWLNEHAANVHSQIGEDGMIAALFDVLGDGQRWCVELGAWDGINESNTRALFEQGWSGVLIEADPVRFRQLQANYAGNEGAHLVCQMVDFEGANTLGEVLGRTPIPRDFDLLSLDVDGNDLHLWRSIEPFRPRVVVIEYNPTIPNDVDFVQPADPAVNQGVSLRAMTRFAKERGYELVGVTDWNAFYVRAEEYPALEMASNDIDDVRTDTRWETRVYQLFDGTLVYEGNTRLLWSGGEIHPGALQPLPRWARFFHHAESGSRWRWLAREVLFRLQGARARLSGLRQ